MTCSSVLSSEMTSSIGWYSCVKPSILCHNVCPLFWVRIVSLTNITFRYMEEEAEKLMLENLSKVSIALAPTPMFGFSSSI